MHRASLRLRMDSPEAARVLAGALGPEAETDLPKSSVTLTRDGDALVLTLEAGDLPTLRAVVNSYLRWCATALEVARATQATGAP